MASSKNTRSRKRKANEESACDAERLCILHSENSDNEHFTYLSSVKEPEARLKRLHDIRDTRLNQLHDSKNRMETICNHIPSSLGANHGYHRDCYNHFTKHVDRLRLLESPMPRSSTDSRNKQRRLSGQTTTTALFTKYCIFCAKETKIAVKKGGNWTTELPTKFKSDSWKTVLEHAESTNDKALL